MTLSHKIDQSAPRQLGSGIIDQVRKILTLIDRRRRFMLVLMGAITLFASLLEVTTVTAIFPLLKVLLDGEKSIQSAAMLTVLQDLTQGQIVLLACGVLLALFFTKMVVSLWSVWFKSRIQTRLYQDIAVRLLKAYLAAPISFHLRQNATALQRNLNSYVSHVTQFGILGLIDIASDVVLAGGIFVALYLIKPTISVMALVSIGFTAGLYMAFGRARFLAFSRSFKASSGKMYRLSLEAVTGIKTIKVLGREEFFVDQYRQSVSLYCDTMRRNTVAAAFPRQMLEFAAVTALIIIVSWAVISGKDMKSVIPVLAVFAAAAFRLMPAFVRITNSMQNFRFAHDAIETIYHDITNLGGAISPHGDGIKKSGAGQIVLRGASFAYTGCAKPAVDGVDITINAGEAVALVGASGAGKTTLADVILGLHKLNAGCLIIDGVEYRDPGQIPRGMFGYVPQDPFLTDDTILRNIALGLPDSAIDRNRVNASLKAAALDRFVDGLPAGLDTVIGDRGVRLSGGQRQRIGIARALYVDPEFLVLDEATSSIDMTTEAEITEAINRLRRVKTVIVIAHRLSTVRECDRIVFLRDGRVIDEGSFDDLVRNNGEFAEMVRHIDAQAPQDETVHA
jgi:ATP-binding cassette subfamily C protein